MYEIISGGVTAAQGFSAGATRCGIKASSQKDDTAIIFSEIPCTAAAVYTKNRVKASPIQVTRDHLANQVAQAVIVNSGNANACAPDGMENAQREAVACAKLLTSRKMTSSSARPASSVSVSTSSVSRKTCTPSR